MTIEKKCTKSELKKIAHHEQEKKLTPISHFKKITVGLYSPFKSPKISPKRKSIETPMSYSKALKTGISGSRSICLKSQSPLSYSKEGKLGGTTSPLSGKNLFDSTTKILVTEIAEFNSNSSQLKIIADGIFKTGSGISDVEVRKLLNEKPSKGNKWELKKQIDASNRALKALKTATNSLVRGKNLFFSEALENEKKLTTGWARAIHHARHLDKERAKFTVTIKRLDDGNNALKTKNQELVLENSEAKERIVNLDKEVEILKTKLAESERNCTQSSIAWEVEKARSEQATKQTEGWRNEISNLESGKAEAIKQAEGKVTLVMEKEKTRLREELSITKSKMESREEELGRLVGKNTNGNSIVAVKEELDRLNNYLKDLEAKYALKESELVRAVADAESACARVASKDRDMSELMKGLGDIQKSGQAREEEANKLRKDAEMKSSELDKNVTELKGEISMLIHSKEVTEDILKSTKAETVRSEEAMFELKSNIEEIKKDLISQSSQLQLEKELRGRSDQKEQEERNERIALSAQMVAMTKEHAQVEAQLREGNESLDRKWNERLEHHNKSFSFKEKELSEAKEIIARLEAEIESLKQALSDQKSIAHAKSAEEISRLKGEINFMKERSRTEEKRRFSVGVVNAQQVKHLESQVVECQSERRRLHNLIQELRGNVRVFARIRPFLPGDGVDDDAKACIIPNSDTSLKLLLDGKKSQEYQFNFDRVFAPSVGQEAVFMEVSEFVQSALDGYNVCLFSYGQTGSGKTHTMQGTGSGQMRGIIPRAIEQVGDYKELLEKDGWNYEMKVSFLEIYNETIRDLLRENTSDMLKHEIKVGSDGRRYVSDLTLTPLEPKDTDAVDSIMRLAAKHRSVGSTEMNATSSRSHSVFALHLTAFHPEQRKALKGTLSLVDLAGSERLDRSGATGDRAKEAMAINKSLSSLTDVFAAIGKKSKHIPFRNSKLTYLLQPSLSGNGKTLMLANMSPTDASTQESLCSLRFASHVNKCELGKAKRSVEDINTDDECSDKEKSIPVKRIKPKTVATLLNKGTPKKRNVVVPLGRNVKSRPTK